jgi:glycosyltransferase involved in cell wall biosynthesis
LDESGDRFVADVELVLLTSEFPFGSVTESFLEPEIPILSERFAKVYVLPSKRGPNIRPLPANFELVEMPWLAGYSSHHRRRALAGGPAIRVALASLRTPSDAVAHLRASKLYGDILAQNILRARDLQAFIVARKLESAVFYDYWFENSTLALALVRRSGAIRTAVARAHGFDIFDDAWNGLTVPFRQAKATGLDAVFPTSSAGARYLRARVPGLRAKLSVHHLGVRDPQISSPPPTGSAPPLVVTCARLVPVKRIHLVPEVLSLVGEPVRWVHIGDGDERERVEATANALLPAGSWELLGSLDNDHVLDFYKQHSVQALLSVSASEGLPVSMMEALSYGVPVVSYDVGGVGELVTPRTGRLIAVDASAADVAAHLRLCIQDPDLSRDTIRAEFRRRYDAAANHQAFVDGLLALHRSKAATA